MRVAARNAAAAPATRPSSHRSIEEDAPWMRLPYSSPTMRRSRDCWPSWRRRPSGASRPASELFATIKGELAVHETIEEEIFYPELKTHPKAKDIVLEGFEEHHVVDLLMGELESLDVEDESWGAKATVMKENIEHHIEEEEGEMFKTARSVFDEAELEDLGAPDGTSGSGPRSRS